MKKVVIIQRSTPEYRYRFFELLKSELALKDMQLDLIYGEQDVNKKNDFKPISWAHYKKNVHIKVGKYTAIWQKLSPEINNADLVIVNQHNMQLANYLLMASRLFSKKRKIAFWDHGRNMQSNKNSIANRIKRLYTTYCDWWFAYTNGVKQTLIDKGYPASKITVVQNSIDTNENTELFHSIPAEEVLALKEKYKLNGDEWVGIYCGALYKEKRIEFLLETADEIYRANPKFRLLVVGDGPDRAIVQDALADRPWLIWAGSQFARNKALHFKISDFFLLPGAIGLAVLDSFSFGTPIITTTYPYHGPEFEYLENNINSIITEDSKSDYVQAVSDLLRNPEKLRFLQHNCTENASKITIENMVKNFTDGILAALQ
jgi:glycosyltransferase involved in cell wall biosynthesis